MRITLRRRLLAAGSIALSTMAIGTVAFALPLSGVIDQRSPAQGGPAGSPGVGIPGKLVFQGSTTVGPIVAASVPAYNAFRGSTVIEGSAGNFVIQNGSGQGRQAASQHWTDIGPASSIAAAAEPWLNVFSVSRDGLVFMINMSGPEWTGHKIFNMTKAQVDDIYEGRKFNWNQVVDGVTGVTGPNLVITPRARIIGGGTRAAWKDVTGGTLASPDVDPAFDPAWVAGTNTNENRVIAQTQLTRFVHNVDTLAAMDQPTASGQCGYTGMGQANGTFITEININDPTRNAIFWAPTGINIYSGTGTTANYPFARFLYVVTPKYVETTNDLLVPPSGTTPYTPANASDISNYISWLRATDGLGAPSGQSAATDAGFLKLIPNEDVDANNTVNVLDLISVGNLVGSGATLGRSDVDRNGSCNVLDLISVGNWVGVNIIPAP